jgi:hypothetical protein
MELALVNLFMISEIKLVLACLDYEPSRQIVLLSLELIFPLGRSILPELENPGLSFFGEPFVKIITFAESQLF